VCLRRRTATRFNAERWAGFTALLLLLQRQMMTTVMTLADVLDATTSGCDTDVVEARR